MWRSVLAVVLAASVVLTQSEGLAQDSAVRIDSTPPSRDVKYQQFTYFHELRRGTAEMALVSFFDLQYVTSPRSPVAEILPLNLQLEDFAGVEVEHVRYPETRVRKFAFQSQPIPVVPFYDQSIRFDLRANETIPLGPHILKGKLTFQLISDSGISAPEHVDFEFPITVVERGTKVQKTEWSRTQNTRRERTLLIIFGPVLVIVWLAACIPGSILGYCKGS